MMQSFKAFETAAWERKAERYAATWGSVTDQAAVPTLDAAGVRAGTRLLDCGCGSGLLAARASALGASVTGCDYSEEMLRLARAAHPSIEFVREDAEALSFPAETFDAVTLNYLLLHLGDQHAALREAGRVLKEGGAMAYTVWLPPSESPGLSIIFDALRAHADMSVIPPGPDIFMFASEAAATPVLESMGFSSVRARRLDTEWRVRSGEELFAAVQAGTRMGGLIELQEPPVKAKIEASIVDGARRFERGGECVIPTPSVVVSAAKRVR